MAAVLRPLRAEAGSASSLQKAASPTDVRVMIVDDSLTVRTVFSRMIDREGDMAIVATAGTAEKAITVLRSTRVDVILLDLEMPGMGGLEALPSILETGNGAQVLVVSSLTEDGAEHTLSALSMGAADTMLKPRPGGFNDDYRTALLRKIRALGGKLQDEAEPAAPITPVERPKPRIVRRPKVIAIGASTGGIHAINLFLRKLPRTFDLPILITQHLPASFIPVFARQMEVAAAREAVLADEGVAVTRGRIIIAPGHGHMVLRKSAGAIVTGLAFHPCKSGCTPSVDPMFETAAQVFDGHVTGILLSGMGRDGTEGAQRIVEAGGAIFAQDEASSAVWGMPRGVSESGIASAVLPPEALAEKVLASAGAEAWL